MVAAVKGYKLILTMPETMSIETAQPTQSLRRTISLNSQGPKAWAGPLKKLKNWLRKLLTASCRSNSRTLANPKIHRETTGPEIWNDTDGKVDILVAGVGTGGTITGVAQYIKPLKPAFKAIAVEPAASPVLSGGQKGPHKIQGIGAGFKPDVLKLDLVDEIFKVTDDDALKTARQLGAKRRFACRYIFGCSSFTRRLKSRSDQKTRANSSLPFCQIQANATLALYCSKSQQQAQPPTFSSHSKFFLYRSFSIIQDGKKHGGKN